MIVFPPIKAKYRPAVGAGGYATFDLWLPEAQDCASFLVSDPKTMAWGEASDECVGMMCAAHVSGKHTLFCKLLFPVPHKSSGAISPTALHLSRLKMALFLKMARVRHPPKRYSG